MDVLVLAEDPRPLLPRVDRMALIDVFHRRMPQPGPAVKKVGAARDTLVDNPFAYTRDIYLSAGIIQGWGDAHYFAGGPFADEERWLLDFVGEQALRRMMELIFEHGVVAESLLVPHTMTMTVSGIRYFLEPGTTVTGMGFHQDNCRFQALLFLQRPKGMSGGENEFALAQEPDDALRYLATVAPHNDERFLASPAINHLLVFDGSNTFHAARGITVPAHRNGHKVLTYRDVISVCLR